MLFATQRARIAEDQERRQNMTKGWPESVPVTTGIPKDWWEPLQEMAAREHRTVGELILFAIAGKVSQHEDLQNAEHRTRRYLMALDGISRSEWEKVKHMIERNFDESEDKQKVCNLLAETLRATRNFWDVTGIAYNQKEEQVTVQFLNGKKSINVAADSGAAMIKDIMDHI